MGFNLNIQCIAAQFADGTEFCVVMVMNNNRILGEFPLTGSDRIASGS